MKKLLTTFTIFTTLMQAQLLDYDIKPNSLDSDTFMKIKLLDTKELKLKNVSELSGLAYKKNTLYAVSDRGFLYHFNLEIKADKIKKLSLKKTFALQDKNAKRLKKVKRDSEGITLLDNALLISFEKKSRVESFTLNGVTKKKQKVHKELRNLDSYQKANKGLEAVTYSKKYGIITAPELTLKGKNKAFHILYSKKKKYKFPARGSITSLEFINKNELLVLERVFNRSKLKWVITLSRVNLKESKKSICKQSVLARFATKNGWKVDNFEGLTKISKNKFLMISDDNGTALQKTLLVFFEILD